MKNNFDGVLAIGSKTSECLCFSFDWTAAFETLFQIDLSQILQAHTYSGWNNIDVFFTYKNI